MVQRLWSLFGIAGLTAIATVVYAQEAAEDTPDRSADVRIAVDARLLIIPPGFLEQVAWPRENPIATDASLSALDDEEARILGTAIGRSRLTKDQKLAICRPTLTRVFLHDGQEIETEIHLYSWFFSEQPGANAPALCGGPQQGRLMVNVRARTVRDSDGLQVAFRLTLVEPVAEAIGENNHVPLRLPNPDDDGIAVEAEEVTVRLIIAEGEIVLVRLPFSTDQINRVWGYETPEWKGRSFVHPDVKTFLLITADTVDWPAASMEYEGLDIYR